MATVIVKPAAPNLPIAPRDYSSQYAEQLNNVLRLYFNQVNSALNTMSVVVNTLEDEVATLQTEVADLQIQGNNSQALIWLDM